MNFRLLRRTPVAALLIVFAGPASAIVVDHSSLSSVSGFSQAQFDAIGQQKWLFTHASVGSNIVNGMDQLHSANSTRYQLSINSWGTKGTFGGSDYSAFDAPGAIDKGTIYEVARGNPDWTNKIQCFENSLKPVSDGGGGWATKVDFAMNKFCWIDPYADADAYLASMDSLQALYPTLKLVYTTAPLTGLEDSENDLRNAFNEKVRAHCAGNANLLYDVADLEAWGLSGVESSYVSNGKVYQKMSLDYANGPDGGDWHLNVAGQQTLATGWYALAGQETTAVPEPATIVFGALAMTILARKRRSR